jgi:transcription antitermination factor NusG
MDLLMGAHQGSECRATQAGSPATAQRPCAAEPQLRSAPHTGAMAQQCTPPQSCTPPRIPACSPLRDTSVDAAQPFARGEEPPRPQFYATRGEDLPPQSYAPRSEEPRRAQWYAAYTCANHERRVAEQLAARGIEHFLPQYESTRKWKDRKIRLQMPLFPGYIFVQMELANRLRVLQVPGVARLVGFEGRPASVPEEDLQRVREFLAQGFRAEPHRVLKVGRRVRVTAGPLAGMAGIVARRKNGHKLVISFDLIQQAMAVEIAGEDLEEL